MEWEVGRISAYPATAVNRNFKVHVYNWQDHCKWNVYGFGALIYKVSLETEGFDFKGNSDVPNQHVSFCLGATLPSSPSTSSSLSAR